MALAVAVMFPAKAVDAVAVLLNLSPIELMPTSRLGNQFPTPNDVVMVTVPFFVVVGSVWNVGS